MARKVKSRLPSLEQRTGILKRLSELADVLECCETTPDGQLLISSRIKTRVCDILYAADERTPGALLAWNDSLHRDPTDGKRSRQDDTQRPHNTLTDDERSQKFWLGEVLRLLGWLARQGRKYQYQDASHVGPPCNCPPAEFLRTAVTHLGEGGEKPAVDEDPSRKKNEEHTKVGREALSVAILAKHPEWTVTQIAKELNVPRTSLYRSELFKKVLAVRKEGRETRHKGRRTVNDLGLGDVEAIDPGSS